MSPIEIRLECLKLAHAHGRETPQVVERAASYAKWVETGNAQVEVVLARLVREPETAGNPFED